MQMEPMYGNACLQGLSICCAATLNPKDHEMMENLAKALGGTLVAEAHSESVVVADGILCSEYEAAIKLGLSSRIVRPSWLTACQQAQSKVPEDGHRLGPCSGLRICTSGHSAAEKAELGKLIEGAGGTYCKNLTKACTHLVLKCSDAAAAMSDKERHARNWGTVRITWDSWLVETAQAGVYRGDEHKHAVERPGAVLQQLEARQQQQGTHTGAPPLQPLGLAQPVMAPDVGEGALECRNGHPAAQQQGDAPVLGPAGAPQSRQAGEAAGHAAGDQGNPASGGLSVLTRPIPEAAASDALSLRAAPSVLRPSTRAVHAASEGDAYSSGRSPEPPLPPGNGQDRRQQHHEPADDAFPFLDGLRILLACCARGELMELASICRKGGACRYTQLTPLITHIVVGSDHIADELAGVREHEARHRTLVRVVDAGWLRSCASAQQRTSEDAWPLRVAARLDGGSGGGGGSGALAALPRTSSEAPPLERSGTSRGGTTAPDEMAGGNTSYGQSAGARRPLEDCWITLAALEGDSDERAHVHDMIRQAGGRIFDAKRVNLVANAACVYAVCPLSFPPERQAEAAQHPDFNMVPEARRVTPYWVELSIDMGSPVTNLGRDRVTCKPLPYPLPLPGMADVKVCASNMSEEAKDAVKELTKHLGGKYTAKMTRANSHLVTRTAMGDKWRAAARFGVCPVTPDWLVDSALAGQLLPESRFEPREPAPGEEAANPGTQFPFDLTSRPANSQHASQRPADNGPTSFAGAFFPREDRGKQAGGARTAVQATTCASAEASSAMSLHDKADTGRRLQHPAPRARAADSGRPQQRVSMLEAALGAAATSAAEGVPPRRDHLEEFALGLEAPNGPQGAGGPNLDPLEALLDANSRAGPLSTAELAPLPAGSAEQAALPGGSPRATRAGTQPKSRFQAMQNGIRGAKENISEPLAAMEEQQKHNLQQDPHLALALARLEGMLETVSAPALPSSQADCFARQAARGTTGASLLGASSAASGRSGDGGTARQRMHSGSSGAETGAAPEGGAASAQSGGSAGGGCSRLRKRVRPAANSGGGSGKRPARSGGAPSAPQLDCSQQVGYGAVAAAAPAAVKTRRQAARSGAKGGGGASSEGTGAEELVKSRLAHAVRASGGRGAAAKGQDELREMGLMD